MAELRLSGVCEFEICPVEVCMTDGLRKGVGKDAEMHATEAADGLCAQITIVLTGKMGEVLVMAVFVNSCAGKIITFIIWNKNEWPKT